MKKLLSGILSTVCITACFAATIQASPAKDIAPLSPENSVLYSSEDIEPQITLKEMVDKYVEELNRPMSDKVLEYAKTFIGVPYVYGGSSPSGFDCSGFVKYVLKNFDIDMPRTSYSQMSVGTPVSIDEIQPGDILFFRGGDHVGFYVGDGQYLHSPRTGRSVSIDPLTRDIYCARRIF